MVNAGHGRNTVPFYMSAAAEEYCKSFEKDFVFAPKTIFALRIKKGLYDGIVSASKNGRKTIVILPFLRSWKAIITKHNKT